MDMGEYLYNTHDLPVVITIGQCLLLASILLLTREVQGTGNGLLAALVLTFGIQALDVLMYWNINVKPLVAPLGVWPFWALKWIPLLQGPLLFAYVSARVTGQPLQFPKHLVHLALPLAGCLLLLLTYHSMDESTLQAGLHKYGMWYKQAGHRVFMWLNKFGAVGYGIWALWFLQKNIEALKNRYSNEALAHPMWLNLVIIGFLVIHLWASLMVVASFFGFNNVTTPMGIIFNYLVFIFVNTLVFFSLLKSHLVVIEQEKQVESESKDDPFANLGPKQRSDAVLAKQLQEVMLERELYLNPDLTLLQLADALSIEERKSSEVINEHLGQNFFELVNLARIARAKELLDDTKLPVQTVYARAGFNSKATFYRIFKRYEHVTPTKYRQRQDS